MQIHCLGTTGYHPSPNRHTACYYLPDLDLLLDAGTGLFRLIPLLLANPRKRLNVLLSHAHLDHVIGLTFLLDVMSVTELKEVSVYGQGDKLEAIQKNLYSPLLFPVPPSFEFRTLPGSVGRQPIGDCDVEYFPLEHPGGSIGLLISAAGKRIAYLTDTTPLLEASWIPRLNGVDLLLHECYFDDSQIEMARKTGHSWLSGVTRLVELAKPKRTALIHINPLAEMVGKSIELDERHHQLNIQWAQDEMIIDF